MSDERCDKTDLLVDQCSHCRGNDQTPQEQADAERRDIRKVLLAGTLGRPRVWFAAEWPGVCYRCGFGFERGAAIRRVQAGLGVAYAAECCAEAPS